MSIVHTYDSLISVSYHQDQMAKISEIGPGTAVGKQILEQFLNWEKTNFKPWGKNVGGANHYNSSAAYRVVSASAFRSQAKKIARIALES